METPAARHNLSTRSGHYVRQPQDYYAFIPKGLPPEPPIRRDDEMDVLISQADRALGRLDGSTEILPNRELFVKMYVRKEAVLSSQIEDSQATLMDVLKSEVQAPEPKRIQDIKETSNYVSALDSGLERLESLPLSLRLIREIHEKLLSGVRGSERDPGHFRQSQNWIGPHGCTLATARYIPPPQSEMHKALDNFEKFLHDKRPMPVLIKVGLAHAQFETIHPFLDGNGRVGRLLITFMLCEKDVLKKPLLYLSHFFRKNRSEYYDYLQNVRDRGEWEEWLKFFLRGVYEVSQEATNTARNIVNLREQHRKLITEKIPGSAGNAIILLESLYRLPIVTANGAAGITETSYPNANELVKKLCSLGVLQEITGQQRNRLFLYEPYLKLFSDPTE